MLLKIRSSRRTKILRLPWDSVSTRRAILSMFSGDNTAKLMYQDSENEYIVITDDADMEACVENFRIAQRLTSTDDVKITLFVVLPGENPNAFTSEVQNEMVKADMGFLPNDSASGHFARSNPNVYTSPFESNKNRTPERKVYDRESEFRTPPKEDERDRHNEIKDAFQVMIFKLFTEPDESKLRMDFPLLFKLDGDSFWKRQGRLMEAIRNLQNGTAQPFKPTSVSPQTAASPSFLPPSMTTPTKQVYGAPVQTMFIGQNQYTPQQMNPNQLPMDARRANSPFRGVGLAGNPYGYIPFDPTCQNCRTDPSHQHYVMPPNYPAAQLPAAAVLRSSTPDGGVFTKDQLYFMSKLKQYLGTDELPTTTIQWVRSRLLSELRDRDKLITNCYMDIIKKMEKEKVFKSPRKRRLVPAEEIEEEEERGSRFDKDGGFKEDDDRAKDRYPEEEDAPAKIAKNDRGLVRANSPIPVQSQPIQTQPTRPPPPPIRETEVEGGPSMDFAKNNPNPLIGNQRPPQSTQDLSSQQGISNIQPAVQQRP